MGAASSGRELLARLRGEDYGKTRRILVVECGGFAGRSLASRLSGADCAVDVVEDDVSAFTCCLEDTYDVIVVSTHSALAEPLQALQPRATFLFSKATNTAEL